MSFRQSSCSRIPQSNEGHNVYTSVEGDFYVKCLWTSHYYPQRLYKGANSPPCPGGRMCRLNISILLFKDNVKIQTLYSYTRDSERVVAADWHLNGFEASNGSENNRDCNEGDFTAMSYCGG